MTCVASSLLLGTVGAALALLCACGGNDKTPGGGTSGTHPGVGGASGAGMAGGGTAGTGATTDCMATGTATQSDTIGSVFNIVVTTDLPGFDGGHIDFGLDTHYGYTAPLDMAAGKTTLLGMKANKDYHYRVAVTAGGGAPCFGPDQTVTTTDIINGTPTATIATPGSPEKLSGGFLISEFYAGQKKVPYILDKDLEMVWAYDPKFGSGGDVTRARMSIDAKWMWVAHGNVPNANGLMKKIAMDGSSEVDMSDKFVRMNHDFTIIDDANQTMYFIAYAASGICDDIVEFDPVTGANRIVMNTSAAFDDGAPCHCNAIDYSPMDDSLIVSDLDHHALIKLDRKTGATKWVLNGCTQNDFTGEGSTWTGPEHGFHILGPDHILLFNNVVGMVMTGGSCPTGSTGSLALELELDEAQKTATKLWSYASANAIQNAIMGDVQRMANGNTIIAYSLAGIIHEVDAAGTLLQSITYGAGGAIGYILKRPDLYGKPIR